MAEQLNITAISTDDRVQCVAYSRSNPGIFFDYRQPIGQGRGYTGLEGLLASLAACSGTTAVYLLRKRGISVTGYKVEACGTRQERPPYSLERIVLDFYIQAKNASDDELRLVVEDTEKTCPVWTLIRNNVHVEANYHLVLNE